MCLTTSRYVKAGGGYELLLFFFHQPEKHTTVNWSMTLSSLREYLMMCDSSYGLTKWTGEALNITFLFYQMRWVCRQSICIWKVGLRGQLCFYQPWCPWLPISWKVVWPTWSLSRPSWHLHQQLAALPISIEKLRASSRFPQTAVWRCGSSAALESRLLRVEKHFKIRLWCPWWKHSLPSSLILKKKRSWKKPRLSWSLAVPCMLLF